MGVEVWSSEFFSVEDEAQCGFKYDTLRWFCVGDFVLLVSLLSFNAWFLSISGSSSHYHAFIFASKIGKMNLLVLDQISSCKTRLGALPRT